MWIANVVRRETNTDAGRCISSALNIPNRGVQKNERHLLARGESVDQRRRLAGVFEIDAAGAPG
jgi:hypothetical protein